MFEDDSRYARLAIRIRTDAQGREQAYVSRRIIPGDPQIAGAVRVQEGDRLDLLDRGRRRATAGGQAEGDGQCRGDGGPWVHDHPFGSCAARGAGDRCPRRRTPSTLSRSLARIP